MCGEGLLSGINWNNDGRELSISHSAKQYFIVIVEFIEIVRKFEGDTNKLPINLITR